MIEKPVSPADPFAIPDQTGRRALITGANSGIGFFTALELARHGATVVLACRDTQKAESAAARIRSALSAASVEILQIDLASLGSIRRAAEAELARNLGLDLLINNAGVMAPRRRLLSIDGFELQFGTNVLGPFALTARLMPALVRAARSAALPPRVVTVASIAHKRGRIRFDDLQSKRRYSPMEAYAQTKLADLIFAFELERRLGGSPAPLPRIQSLAAHPGVANTNLFQAPHSSIPKPFRRLLGAAIDSLLNTEAQGALPTLYAATSPDAIPGGYYGPQGFREMRGTKIGPARIAPQARVADTAANLWQACQDLTGLMFP
jgi:NAD(P)-dependent dehydrogenase (short-subunit alcohol dehydrogenase family)